MNLLSIYNSLISRAKNRPRPTKTKISKEIKIKMLGEDFNNFEIHHIIPKCMGGTDEEKNLVFLTIKEHILCHRLLAYIYEDNIKLQFAYVMMYSTRDSARISLSQLSEFRKIRNYMNKTGREVIQLSDSLEYIAEFSSIEEAGNITKCNKSTIGFCCRGLYKTSGGFCWIYKDEYVDEIKLRNYIDNFYSLPSINEKKRVAVVQLTENYEYVDTYESMAFAGKETGINISNISQTTLLKQRSSGGYVWIKLSDYNNSEKFSQFIEINKNLPSKGESHKRPIYLLDNSYNILRSFNGIVDVIEELNIPKHQIEDIAAGRKKCTCLGQIFCYKEVYNSDIKRNHFIKNNKIVEPFNNPDKTKEIVCLNLTTKKVLNIYNSLKDAASSIGLSSASCLSLAASGFHEFILYKKANFNFPKGFLFIYLDDFKNNMDKLNDYYDYVDLYLNKNLYIQVDSNFNKIRELKFVCESGRGNGFLKVANGEQKYYKGLILVPYNVFINLEKKASFINSWNILKGSSFPRVVMLDKTRSQILNIFSDPITALKSLLSLPNYHQYKNRSKYFRKAITSGKEYINYFWEYEPNFVSRIREENDENLISQYFDLIKKEDLGLIA